ncbi:MAG: hypothetical protein R6V04_16760 [bacterium]
MKKRLIPILILLTILGLLCVYTGWTHPWLNIKECLQNPEQHDSKLITEYWEPKIGKIYPDGFQMIQRHAPSIKVYCDTSGLKTGEFVGIKAVFKKEGYLIAEKVFIASNRQYKIWLSVIPVLIIFFLFLRYYKFNLKKFQFQLKEK